MVTLATGTTLMLKLMGDPKQQLFSAITVIVLGKRAFPGFWAVNPGIAPVPLAAKPIPV